MITTSRVRGRRSRAGIYRALAGFLTAVGVCRAYAQAVQQPTIRVDVGLVNLYITVTDQRGLLVTDLRKDNFRVWDDEVEQEIRHFSTDDAPYTVGLVLDRSGSMSEVIGDVYKAAIHTLEASKSEDEAFAMIFDDQLELVQDFTSDRNLLLRSLRKVRARGSTALYDAVYTALKHSQKGRYRKKALLVVTDGADNSSEITYRELLEFAGDNPVIIYVIGLFGNSMQFGSLLSDTPDVDKLSRLAEATGGKAYFPKAMEACKQACSDIANELRHQYSIGYYPPDVEETPKRRAIHVELTNLGAARAGNLVVRTRAIH